MYTYSIPPCTKQFIDMLLQEPLSELHDLVAAEYFIPKQRGLHSCWSDKEGIGRSALCSL